MKKIMFEVRDLSFDYADKPLLQALSFEVSKGEILYLQGHNGAGKTTLLKLLAGILIPISGQICYKGQNIHEDMTLYRTHICYIGHKNGISLKLSIRENYAFELTDTSKTDRFNEVLSRWCLNAHDDVLCGLLSAGQRRKIGLLRLFLTDAPLWLLDEPLTSLDVQSCELLFQLFMQHLARGGCIIFSSHQPVLHHALPIVEYCL